MKKLKWIFKTSIILVILISATLIFSSGALGGKFLSPSLALAEEEQTVDQTQSSDETISSEDFSTPFFIDITSVAMINSGEDQEILVFDKYDGLIKILDKDYNFKAENSAFKPTLSNVTKVFVGTNYILLYDANSSAFEAYDFEYNLLPFEFSTLDNLSNAKFIDIVTVDEKDYIFIASDTVDNKFQLAQIAVSGEADEKSLNLGSPLNFSVHELYSSITSFDSIYLTQHEDNLLVMLINTSGILSFEISPDAENDYVVTTTTSVTGFEEENPVRYVKNITLSDKDIVAVQTDKEVDFYSLSLSPTIQFEKISDDEIENSLISFADVELTDIFAYDDKIAVISNQTQSLYLYTISGTSENYTITFATKTNPEVEITYLDVEDLSYLNIDSDTFLVDSPYSRTKIIDINENQNVVKIATASSDGETVVGWSFVLVSVGNENYYGFVESSLLSPLEKENIDITEGYVLNFTALRKYPSLIQDQTNTTVMRISSNSKVKILSDIYGYSSLGTTYLLVEVDNQIGFIDSARLKTQSYDNTAKIITNSVVIRDSSQIFAEADDNSEVITYLNRGARVKVLGKRDTINNLTHITFNDEYGNEISGYIYTSNLKTDTWSMLQIIGMVLVILNVILLIVIVIIKNKLAK